MSSGSIGAEKEPITFKFMKYCHLHLTQEDYCGYEDECDIVTNIGGDLCWICKYAKKLDIPKLLIEKGRR
ncbi:MAG: hypothetical protein K9L62_10975 [Vallitaleaceae bacterium]|nr:hypothetical protein [Vallitaleaceae bacterium]